MSDKQILTAEEMSEFIKATDDKMSCINYITDFLEDRYLAVLISHFDDMHYDNKDLILLRQIYYMFDDEQIADDKKEKVKDIKSETIGMLNYFAKHMTGHKAAVFCMIGDIHFNMKTNYSIRKSVTYYQKAMRKGSKLACKKLHRVFSIYSNGDQKLGIDQDDAFAEQIYDIVMHDLTEDNDI